MLSTVNGNSDVERLMMYASKVCLSRDGVMSGEGRMPCERKLESEEVRAVR